MIVFFFKQKTAYEMRISDWSSDVCSSDLQEASEVVVQGPNLEQVFLTNTGQLLTMMVVTGILLFFLLANGYLFLLKTVHILPRFSDKKRAVEIGRALQVEVSRYLFTITAINIGLGFATAAVMVALGLPDPLLWGVMATLLNFIPARKSTSLNPSH